MFDHSCTLNLWGNCACALKKKNCFVVLMSLLELLYEVRFVRFVLIIERGENVWMAIVCRKEDKSFSKCGHENAHMR